MAGQNAPKLAVFCTNLATFRLSKLPLTIVSDSEKLNGNAFLSMSWPNTVVYQRDKIFFRVNFA
jgi:hypothetical protein